MSEIEFNVLLRKPRYPVIVVSGDRLYSASTVKQLGMACVGAIPVGAEKKRIVVIDANGEEFWYSTEHYALMPGLLLKKWTKKRKTSFSSNRDICHESWHRKVLKKSRKNDATIRDEKLPRGMLYFFKT